MIEDLGFAVLGVKELVVRKFFDFIGSMRIGDGIVIILPW